MWVWALRHDLAGVEVGSSVMEPATSANKKASL